MSKKPNIVFLLNDHQAYYRHGWDGGVKPQRPHFDRLARDGVVFERAYCASPLCTPARRSMLTGLLPHNHGFITLDPSENTEERDKGILYQLLAEQGYQNFYYGKWHSGPGTAKDFGCEGFSYPEFGNPYNSSEYAEYVKKRELEPASFDLDYVFIEPCSPDDPEPTTGPGYKARAPHLHSHVVGAMETPAETHESFFLANLACGKLREISENGDDQPFAMHVHFYGPHAPYLAAKEYVDLYDPATIQEYGSFREELTDKPAGYLKEWNSPFCKDEKLILPSVFPWEEWQKILRYVYGQITQVDAAGGIVLDELDRLGLTENTIVVWSTDHGDPIAAHGGHFGKEGFLSEEVLRIPMAIRWPERIQAGQKSQYLVSNMDIPTTLLDAAETHFSGTVDSKSMLELIDEQGKLKTGVVNWREDIMSETHGHHNEQLVARAIVTEKYRYAVYKFLEIPDYAKGSENLDITEELYDLEKDPYQLQNLALRQESRTILEDMRQRLTRWQAQSHDTVNF